MAGALCFYQNRHAVYWHGASRTEASELRPANLLHAQIARHAREAGYAVYDLNPSGGHEGVLRFKRSFGTASLAADVFVKDEKERGIRSRLRGAAMRYLGAGRTNAKQTDG